MASTQPLQFFLEIGIPDGRDREVCDLLERIVDLTHRKDMGALSYQFFLSADRTRAYGIEIHADESALLSHMETVGDLAGELFSIATMESVFGLGEMSDEIKQALAPFNPTFQEERIAGFTR